MADPAPLTALVKKKPVEPHKEEVTRWIQPRAHPDGLLDEPVIWHGLTLNEIADAVARKAHARIVSQLLARQIAVRLQDEAFCLLDLTAAPSQRIFGQEGLHSELRNALVTDRAAELFPFIFRGANAVLTDPEIGALSEEARDVLEMIKSCWVWATPDAPCVAFVVFGPEACAPSAEQLDFGLAVTKLSNLLFCKHGRAQLSDELAAESQGKKISPGSALFDLLGREQVYLGF